MSIYIYPLDKMQIPVLLYRQVSSNKRSSIQASSHMGGNRMAAPFLSRDDIEQIAQKIISTVSIPGQCQPMRANEVCT